jgi:rare lipoprotein A
MRPQNPNERSLCLVVTYLLFLIVMAIPVHAQDMKASDTDTAKQGISSGVQEKEGTVGKATYYANRYNGRRTSSGEVFNQRKMTAAHSTLPNGTLVKVENLANKRTVVVKINDRVRHGNSEIIDLSRAAARKLGILRQGVAMVQITPVGE